ncbi:uncharacterized protein LOC121372002 isoform X3 [Gigantopelta aegis]|uniref:uncharacterized protein LOC121372002 isoform X3 n=1 Tax=Gigantopelta aegis TaxID=1735272 RepID=UPI001B889D88|nr:uncharacterized protein LOC121372002 isoform X3 [Gigantopelta aegis]
MPHTLITDRHLEELRELGVTVVEGVITEEECDKQRGKYEEWLKEFPKGTWPFSPHGIVKWYRSGHMEPTWNIRMQAKPVFTQLWGTEELLSSIDNVAIGRPPEDGEEDFYREGQHWLHCDQGPKRKGLHCYQGAVYLEHCDEDDWAFEVLEKSHDLFERFYQESEHALTEGKEDPLWRLRHLNDEDLKWYLDEGCNPRRIAVPKGGMILWDSRLIHANARPLRNRNNPGRWRYVVFVSMGPAAWATEHDLEIKRDAYKNLKMTTHWPCFGIGVHPTDPPRCAYIEVSMVSELPEVAKTLEAKRLMGVEPYARVWKPEWNAERIEIEKKEEERLRNNKDKWVNLGSWNIISQWSLYRRLAVCLSMGITLTALIKRSWAV